MSRKKVYPTFDLVRTEAEAKKRCLEAEQNYTSYMKSKYDKPHYNRWFSMREPDSEYKYCVHYYYHI